MSWLPLVTVGAAALGLFGGGKTKTVTQYVSDPDIQRQLEEARATNARLQTENKASLDKLSDQIRELHSRPPTVEYRTDPELQRRLDAAVAENARQNASYKEEIDKLFVELEAKKLNTWDKMKSNGKKVFDALVVLAVATLPIKLDGNNIGFFGQTSTGKSTTINKLLNQEVAETGYGDTTTEIHSYGGNSYCLHDMPGKNDDISYLSMEYISFWKGLTSVVVLVQATIKEMTSVIELLEAVEVRYDIVVNKFDLVPDTEREKFKQQIQREVTRANLKFVNSKIYFVSAQNPQQFPDWLELVNYLTRKTN